MRKIQAWPLDEEIRYDGRVHPLVQRYKYYPAIKWMDMYDNLEYRARLLHHCLESRSRQKAVMEACRDDELFFINTFCLAEGTLVVTNHGSIPIEDVSRDDEVWDGNQWVQHSGVVAQGRKSTILKYGIELTPDHKVRTTHGWQRADKGYDRERVRLPDGYKVCGEVREHKTGWMAVPLRLREGDNRSRELIESRPYKKLRVYQERESAAWDGWVTPICCMDWNEAEVCEPKESWLQALWRSRHQRLQEVGEVRVFHCGHGISREGNDNRTYRQQRELHSRELLLGNTEKAGKQYEEECCLSGACLTCESGRDNDEWNQGKAEFRNCEGGCRLSITEEVEDCDNTRPSHLSRDRRYSRGVKNSNTLPNTTWCDRGGLVCERGQREALVYDISNCGPRQAFTVLSSDGTPLLVHNCFIVEPREGEENKGKIPFITWANQDPVIAAIDYYHGVRHIIGDKSRAQGASWIMMANFVHKFIFFPYQLLGMGSKNEEAADLPDNPDSLGWKFDFLMANLPSWMRPPGIRLNEENRKVGAHTWKNVLNGSTLKAYSATAGIGRSGRFTSFGLDESAFFPQGTDAEAVSNLLNTTNGLLMLSTPNGMNNEHYDRVHNPGPWLKVVLDWRDNPMQSKGKYTLKDGKLFKYDDYPFPDDYQYLLDGRIRSPWYDRQWIQNKGNALLVGQELDREYQGSKGRPFPKSALDRAEGFTRKPIHVGRLIFDSDEPENIDLMQWNEGEGFRFDLWFPLLGEHPMPPEGKYVVALDIATGTGGDTTSNSVIEVFDETTRTQVAEFADNTVPPEELALLAVAVCYWFGHGKSDPHLIWEKNGPGIRFTNEIIASGYPNVYRQKGGDEMRMYAKRSDKPGYHTSDTELTLTPLISGLCACDITIYSKAMLEECAQYLYNDSGKVENPKARTSRDGGSRGLAHGDRPIAAALAIRAMNDRKKRSRKMYVPVESVVPADILGRMNGRRMKRNRADLAMCRW